MFTQAKRIAAPLLPVFIGLLCSLQSALAFTPSSDGLYAVFVTSLGEFTAELYYEEVPLTVASFVRLAEGTHPWVDSITGEIKMVNFDNAYKKIFDFEIKSCLLWYI